MSVEAATKAGGFTDDILSKNFIAISKEFNKVSQWQNHVEDHISELYDMVQVAGASIKQLQAPKGMKTKHKVIIAVAVGLYIGRKSMAREFNEKLEQFKAQAKDQAERATTAVKDTNFLGDKPADS